jgi:hypothetical protein
MKMRWLSTVTLVCPVALMVATTHPAGADEAMSLKDKQQWAEITKHIDDKAKDASEKCGTKITATVDIPSFAGQDIFTQSPTGYCRDAINTLTSLCTFSDISKGAVQKSVSTVTCRKSNDGTGATRSGKELVVSIDPNKTAIKGASWKSAIEDVLVATPPAGADVSEMVLKERLQWAEMTKHIDEKAKLASDKCGVTITAGFDIPSFKGQDLFKQPPTGVCRDVVNTVATLCSTPIGKSTVQKSVSTITCRKGADGTKATRQAKGIVVHADPAKTGIVGKQKGSYSWKSALEEIL